MSSLKDFFYGIATEMGRPKESMDPVIKIFEENWYDSVDSIKDLDEEALAKMKVPLRLIEIIAKKLGKGKPEPQQQPTKMVIEEQKTNTAQKPEDLAFLTSRTNKLNESLDQLKRETIRPQTLLDVLNILEKVSGNIAKDPANEQFRSLKLTNEKLKQNLFAYPAVFDILGLLGFQRKDEVLFLDAKDLNTSFLHQAITELGTLKIITSERAAFDPYKSSFSSTTSVSIDNIKGGQEPSSFDFVDKLEQLKQKRLDAVKSYIEDKQPTVFVLDTNVNLQSFISSRDTTMEEEEEDTKTNDYIFKKEILKWVKEIEESQHFSSRRKKEFEQLLKQPLFTETKVRIKFPNNTVLEGKFSPRERVKNIVDFVRQYLVNPNWDFYLYQTPPVQKITQYNWTKTLEEAEMVPNVLLYFGTDQPLEGVTDFLTLKPTK